MFSFTILWCFLDLMAEKEKWIRPRVGAVCKHHQHNDDCKPENLQEDEIWESHIDRQCEGQKFQQETHKN